MEKEKLLDIIEEKYGFKRELIENADTCGLFFCNFEVNGIKYAGSIPYHGSLPLLNVTGYTTSHYDEYGTPIEDWYYEKFFKGKKARILHCVDGEIGEWEDTGIRCKNQEEAEEYMSSLTDSELRNYKYEMIQED